MAESALAKGAFHDLPDGVYVSDGQGRLLYENRAGRELLEGTNGDASICERLCGRLRIGADSFADVCPLRGAHPAQAAVSARGTIAGRDVRVRCELLEPDRPAGSKHVTFAETVSSDLSWSSVRADWLSLIGHDLRNSLAHVYYALSTLDDLPEEHPLSFVEHGILRSSVRGCARLKDLLDDFNALIRLDSRQLPLTLERLELLPLIDECVQALEPTASAGGICLAVAIPESLAAEADRHLLARVIDNLLDNALKFTPAGGVIGVSSSRAPDGAVLLYVDDSGSGMRPDELTELFEYFGARRTRGPDRGIGLAFCRMAMEAMRGAIAAESPERRGCRFTLTLPAA